jgi:hypothetical protein
MTPLAHHAGEDSLVNLLVLGGGWLSMMLAIGRARLATARNRLARFLRRERGTADSPGAVSSTQTGDG